MILIVGTTHDDILYFDSKLRDKKEETIYKKFKVTIGTMYNQEVMLLSDVYTSYMSSLLISRIIEKYYIVMVFLVGKCVSLTPDVKRGQIMISRYVYFGDINQQGKQDSSLGQIPLLPPFYEGDDYVIKVLEGCFNKLYIKSDARLGTYISTNSVVRSKDDLKEISTNGIYFGMDSNVVFDSESGGTALACYLHGVPFLACKVVEHALEAKSDIDTYIDVLGKYSDLGKALTSCIGEITRNEVKDHD